MKSRMTILDVAREVGVSKTAVSFAFNAPDRLAPATLQRILAKAEELGYVPNPLAQRLARRSSGNLGVLIPQGLPEAFVHPHFQELFRGVGSFCEQNQLSLTIIPPLQGCLITAVRNAAVDGVITLGFTPSAPFLELLRKRDLPLVTVDSRVDPTIPSVTFRDQDRARELMLRILARGFRRIHILTFPPARQEVRGNAGSRSLTRRLRGFKEALEQGETKDVVLTFGVSGVSAREARRSLLRHQWDEGHPEVVVCLSDAQAAGVYEYAEARGLKIPEDLSVTGFDGSLVLKHLRPALTTVVQPGALKGRLAAGLLEAQWKDRAAVRHLVIRGRVAEGTSLGVPAPGFRKEGTRTTG
jgi:DNA-binding LacI/PurR family transcriptional regulator